MYSLQARNVPIIRIIDRKLHSRFIFFPSTEIVEEKLFLRFIIKILFATIYPQPGIYAISTQKDAENVRDVAEVFLALIRRQIERWNALKTHRWNCRATCRSIIIIIGHDSFRRMRHLRQFQVLIPHDVPFEIINNGTWPRWLKRKTRNGGEFFT